MAVALYFKPSGMSAEKYDQVMRDLEAAGASSPEGRTYHAAFGDPSGLQVFDVWDSMEQFQRFGETLMPILQRNGIDAGEPHTAEVRNIVEG